MWMLLALLTVVGAKSPVKDKNCPVYSPPWKPVDCGPNAYWENCPPQCPPHQNCSLLWSKFQCIPDEDYCCKPACRCKDTFYRDDNFKCVTSKQCMGQSEEPTTAPPCPEAPPKPTPKPCNKCKGPNEKWVKCRTICPPQNCDISYTEYLCPEKQKCEAGCDCIKNHLRLTNGTCVLNDDCPPPSPKPTPKPCNKCKGPNEKWVKCRTICPPQNCDISYTEYLCPEKQKCEAGCDCIKNHLRLTNGTCVLNDDCPPPSPKPTPKPCNKCKGPNEKWVKCRTICPPQNCDISYTEYLCPEKQKCEAGCDCIKNHLRLTNGTCVLNDDCPPPQEQCNENETYAQCVIPCPTNYCPTSDVRATVQCQMPRPCPPGCVCIGNRLRKSQDDPTCVLAKDCPPVECTRQNEEWDPCPSSCLAESCGDVNKNITCNELQEYCIPKCVCKKGHYRNDSDICVPACDCEPPINVCRANETYVNCAARCGPYDTCPVDDSRDIIACDPPYPCPPGCLCQVGYRRRSASDDTCILAEDCPPVKCTRPNEVWNSCPSGCLAEYCTQIKDQPSTCNELLKNCQPKCICAEGYYRDENDRCIPASDCGEANCGVNKTIVFCTFKCPNQFCPENDSLEIIACKPPRDCPPGCGCKDGYRFKSSEDDTCVLARDCPPVCCTRPNEEWNSCPPPCYSETCEDRNKKQSECYETEGDCNPKCVCKHGYYRNANKTCVPDCQCD